MKEKQQLSQTVNAFTSKYLIVNTSLVAASGPGSSSVKVLLGGDNIITIVPDGLNQVRIIYQNNVQAVMALSANLIPGDYSVITFLTKQIEMLQNGNSSTLSLPVALPNCFSDPAGHPISITAVSVIHPCCTP